MIRCIHPAFENFSRPFQRLWPVLLFAVLETLTSFVAVHADETQQLPTWKPVAGRIATLGEPFEDARIRVRPAKALKPLARNSANADGGALPGELVIYGWTPTGDVPSATSFLIYVFPPPSSEGEDLDDFVDGFKSSIAGQMEDLTFGEVESGIFQGVEARRGQWKGTLPVLGTVRVVFVVFIDDQGTVAITAMRPAESEGEPTLDTMATSALTFSRAK
jgi:hypothetical protein